MQAAFAELEKVLGVAYSGHQRTPRRTWPLILLPRHALHAADFLAANNMVCGNKDGGALHMPGSPGLVSHIK